MTKLLVLITGSTGFLGFRILTLALEAGYRVRAAIRHQHQIAVLRAAEIVQSHLADLEFIVVPDILREGAYNEAMQGVTHVVHSAFPSIQPTEDFDTSVVHAAIHPTLNILHAAQKTSSVQRVAITSSIIALVPWSDFVICEASNIYTNTSPVLEPQKPSIASPFRAYAYAKTLSLHISSQFMSACSPPTTFALINLLPGFILGPNALAKNAATLLDSSNHQALAPILGHKTSGPTPSLSVHIDDAALTHVKALTAELNTSSTVHNLIVCSDSSTMKWEDALIIAATDFPDAVAAGKLPLGGKVETHRVNVDASETESLFGIKFRGFEEQVRDLVKGYLGLLEGEAKICGASSKEL